MYFFFFKQKTAYEIYQCDWSSDVCSSDLLYHWYRNNDINWCGGAKAQTYSCSTAVVVKTAKEAQPEK